MKNKKIGKIVAGMTVASILTYYSMPAFAYINEETVYSKLNQEGESYKSTVTTIIEDKDGTKTLQDENKEELPIECKITYYLDGKELGAKEIVGKSGRVTIKLEYKNKEVNKVEIDGKEEELYTPFIVVSGVALDIEKNKNIEVNKGKIITNGNKVIAVGIALPGLQESLGITLSDVEIPNTIEISMDTEKFEMGNIMSYATPKTLSELDLDLNSFDEIFSKVSELKDASIKLENGGTELSDGITSLNDGALKINDGVLALDSGIDTLQNGATTLNNGAITLKNGSLEYTQKSEEFSNAMNTVSGGLSSLNSSYSEVNDGINKLNSSSKELNAGAKGVSDGAKTVSDNLNNISGLLGNVASGASNLSNGAVQASNGVNEIVGKVSSQIEASKSQENIKKMQDMQDLINKDLKLISNYQNLVNSIPDKTSSEYISAVTVLNVLQANYSALTGAKATIENTSESVNELYGGLTSLQAGITNIKDGSKTLSDGLSQISSGTSELAKGAEDLKNGANRVASGTDELSNGTESLLHGSSKVVDGISTLDNGAKTLNTASSDLASASKTIATGAKDLQAGTASLVNGVTTLSNGSKELKNGTGTLIDGTAKLYNGSNELKSGIHEFNEEGINPICDLVNNNLKNTLKRVQKLEELSNEYNRFASKEERDDIKFVTITDSIKLDEASGSNKKEGKDKK